VTTRKGRKDEGTAERRPLRTIAYLRVSTVNQAERGMGLDAQRETVRQYASDERLELVELVEEAASGAAREGELFSLEHRPVLSELVARAERGNFDVLLVASLDRLSRDQVEQLYLKRLLARFNVSVVSAAGETNGNGDAIGELIERLIGAVHDFDRKRILERMQSGKREARRRGRQAEGYAPYGYRSVPAEGGGRTLEAVEAGDPSPSEVVRWIFTQAKSGLSPGRIAAELNRKEIPPPRSREKGWNRQTLRNIIENPVFAGERHGVKRAHPAIVSRRLWNAAQAALRSRGRHGSTDRPNL
jgi:DNA invertase Pin-like site-specific DNA recombinase